MEGVPALVNDDLADLAGVRVHLEMPERGRTELLHVVSTTFSGPQYLALHHGLEQDDHSRDGPDVPGSLALRQLRPRDRLRQRCGL